MQFSWLRKSTAYAAQVVTRMLVALLSHGMKEVVAAERPVGRDSAVRALQSLGMIVTDILDVTPVPHNVCRARRRESSLFRHLVGSLHGR